MRELMPLLMKGTLVTIEIAICSILLAIVMAGIATALRTAPWRVVRWIGNVYVEVFRGTSLLVQLFWFFFVLPLPPFHVELTPFTVAIVGLGLHYGAYGSEILRGALRSVPGGQYEAALALNMPAKTRMRRIVLPQAMINALPPATNLMIELLKGTSLVSLITLSDLTFRARQLDEATFKTAGIFTLTLVIYFVLAQIIATVMRHFERRVSSHIVRRTAPGIAK
ncbi:ectoine/hydroxyectoine ABC transporter permease subunit EhuC [Paraburkholderia sp. SIMBA_030]|uniref:ectoine/hydroxyectoine ABC transporter permease subunit EhuC n=1 Tax=Paraburkholderia sp. SIMBA_030 TaxID=3085773 RepID=UPI00397BE85D